MSGNVYEWCSDWYSDYSAGIQTNPKGPADGLGRVIRGGCWLSESSSSCRVTGRLYIDPNYSNFDIGFRLATTVQR
jgi:formylglycine-generating enzyme required for sulfatase activity